jgi:hypothetical protein
MQTIERCSPTEVRVEDKRYTFDSVDQADGFERCARTGRASECLAEFPPRAVAEAAGAQRSGADIEINPPPGGLGEQ